MNAQYRKNLKDVATACKNYTDKKIDDLKWELGSHTLDVESDTTTACTKTVPSDVIGCQINKLGGMSYKSINIWDEQWELGSISTTNGTNVISDTQIRAKNQFRITPSTTYYFKGTSTYFNAFYYGINGDFVSYSAQTINNTFTTPNNAYYMRFNLLSAYGTTYNNDICINVSNASINGTYYPYFEGIRDSAVTSIVSKDNNDTTLDTYTIPAEVQALEGYGWGVNDTCYNYIDFETKKFVKKVGRIDLGTLNYIREQSSGYYRFLTPFEQGKIPASGRNINILSSLYHTNADTSVQENLLSFIASNKNLYLYNDAYTDANTFKTAMSGVYLYYELATPVETDISEYIDNGSIVIEPNGTITYNNTYNQAVPSEVDYLIEEVKA